MVEHQSINFISIWEVTVTPMEKTTIMDRIQVYAEAGKTSSRLRLWKRQIKELQREGFEVEVLTSTEFRGQFLCEVSWRIPRGRIAANMLKSSVEALALNWLLTTT